jgi:hypothetical protein
MFKNWVDRHPWLIAIAALLCGVANTYEGVYIRPGSLMSIVDWVFAALGLLVFLALSLKAVSDHFSKTDD